ncbi:hypothetical protein Y032_0061g3272 [Ancylostoma ceylanicum]|uniref:SCP domain-containing protein n=1 Tax=Ancylostoma ceylanicum TaxID=53326 RepID=A0A016U1W5_9BILA|nr:hypothetical protein Y032_0061g3272 [Ancylostoma ceylanicum]
MGALLIVALLASILPSTLSERHGKGPYCERGQASYEEVWKVLDPIGDLRWRIVRGKQHNGPGGAKMPRPLEMREVMWKCHLEEEAIALIQGRCLETIPITPGNRTELVLRLTGGKHHSYDSVMSVWTKELDRTPMKQSAIGPDNVKYDGEVRLWDYANLARGLITGIGCAQTNCSYNGPNSATKHATLCLINKP